MINFNLLSQDIQILFVNFWFHEIVSISFLFCFTRDWNFFKFLRENGKFMERDFSKGAKIQDI